MRRIFLLLLVSVWGLIPTSAWAAPTFVQGAVGSTGGATSFTITLAGAVTSGNHVMGTIGGFSIPSVTSVVDDQSNAYTVTSDLGFGNGGWNVFGFYRENITNAPTVITVTLGGSVVAAGLAHEVSGLAASSSIDGTPIANRQDAVGNGTDAITTGQITTTANGDYIFAAHWDQFAGGGTISAGTGFTIRQNTTVIGGAVKVASEDQTQTTAGAITPTFSHTTTADVISMTMAFKAAAVSGGQAPRSMHQFRQR